MQTRRIHSLGVVLKDVLPVQGFVVLCPAKPDGLNAAIGQIRGGR